MTTNIHTGYQRTAITLPPRLSRIPRIHRHHIRYIASFIKEAAEKNWPIEQWKRSVLKTLHGGAVNEDEVNSKIPHINESINMRYVNQSIKYRPTHLDRS
jgi:hypothetical protein